MSWEPITLKELKGLGVRIDTEPICADSLEDLYGKLNKFPHEEWTMIRAPWWCGDKLVALIVRPRVDVNYEPGTKLFSKETGVKGEVIDNIKLPGDICVRWETGEVISYDEEWLDENCNVRLY